MFKSIKAIAEQYINSVRILGSTIPKDDGYKKSLIDLHFENILKDYFDASIFISEDNNSNTISICTWASSDIILKRDSKIIVIHDNYESLEELFTCEFIETLSTFKGLISGTNETQYISSNLNEDDILHELLSI